MNERTFRPENAFKLEDPERYVWLPPADVVSALHLRPEMTAVDIGAGTGYFAIPMAEAVGSGGKVIAVDFQKEMLEFLAGKLRLDGMPGNIELVRGEATRTTLSSDCADLVFLANVWHELDDHSAALTEARRILHHDGRIAILDWRPHAGDPPGPPAGHRIAPDEIRRILEGEGWGPGESLKIGKYHYLLIARPGD